MDRCALFVDAGYLLADGAMAVHGTRHRETVSWDFAGLLQLLGNLARERTGLPLLRCYWYEATVEGRRGPEHEALADLPGLKLRLGRVRPGRREGVDTEIHRDLMTLARNGALADAVVVSGDEDLAQVVVDAQDLGVRVTVAHITIDGTWTVARALRQECDDLIEVSSGHLRPYVSLLAGIEPGKRDGSGGRESPAIEAPAPSTGTGAIGAIGAGARAEAPSPLSNGHSAGGPTGPLHTGPIPGGPLSSADAHTGAPPSTPLTGLPSASQTQAPASSSSGSLSPSPAPLPAPSSSSGGNGDPGHGTGSAGAGSGSGRSAQQPPSAGSGYGSSDNGYMQDGGSPYGNGSTGTTSGFGPSSTNTGGFPTGGSGQGAGYGASSNGNGVTTGGFQTGGADGSTGPLPAPGDSGVNGSGPNGSAAPSQQQHPQQPQQQPVVPSQAPPSPLHAAPTAPSGSGTTGPQVAGGPGMTGPAGPGVTNPGPNGPSSTGSVTSAPPPQPNTGPHYLSPNPAQQPPAPARQPGPYTGPQQISPVPAVQQAAPTLADAVKAAHQEGQEFGESVARDAPALWLEAVLARKPRMPSDLEARLLQGSALPIDFLLHDEVRHALRRGFWDALERSRR